MLQTGAQVADKAVQGILSRVDQLAEKLGTTAQQLWQVYIWQSRVEAIRDTALAVLGLAAAGVLVPTAIKLFEKFRGQIAVYNNSSSRDAGERYMAWAIVCLILSTFGVVLFVTFGYDSIGEWINPSYWAFQHLTQDLKNLL